MDTVVMVLGGNFILRNSHVSTKPISKNVKVNIPALVAMPGSRLNLIACDFKGNDQIMCAGIITLNADILMSHCTMKNYKGGGLLISGTNESTIKICDTIISKCGVVGVYCQGEDSRPLILRNTID
jgi:hypothetical protein